MLRTLRRSAFAVAWQTSFLHSARTIAGPGNIRSQRGAVEWRPGVQTKLHAGSALGSEALCVLEQWCRQGTGAPTHTHYQVEELIVVLEGYADFWIDDEHRRVSSGESILLPAHSWHGFENPGSGELHLVASFASANPPVCYQDRPELVLEIAGSGKMLDPHRAIRREAEHT